MTSLRSYDLQQGKNILKILLSVVLKMKMKETILTVIKPKRLTLKAILKQNHSLRLKISGFEIFERM